MLLLLLWHRFYIGITNWYIIIYKGLTFNSYQNLFFNLSLFMLSGPEKHPKTPSLKSQLFKKWLVCAVERGWGLEASRLKQFYPPLPKLTPSNQPPYQPVNVLFISILYKQRKVHTMKYKPFSPFGTIKTYTQLNVNKISIQM